MTADFSRQPVQSGADSSVSVVQPAFVFLGEAFTQSQRHQQLRSLLLDMFQGSPAPEVNAMTMRRVYVCTALSNGSISLRHYSVRLLNAAGSKVYLPVYYAQELP